MIRITYEVVEADSSFKITFDGTTIRLEGFLKGNKPFSFGEYETTVQHCLETVDRKCSGYKLNSELRSVRKDPPTRWIVETPTLTASALGIENWTSAVSDQLPGHQLHYLASPFSAILQRDERYLRLFKDHTFEKE